MQCRNCRFQNMPASDVCGRCGTSLGLATAILDVNPPRAGRWTKRMRRIMPRGRAYYEARDALAEMRSDAAAAVHRVAPNVPPLPPGPILLRLIIPGWSHFYAGQRWRGHLALWGWLAFLIPGLFWFGTTSGSILLGLAFSVHSSAALDTITQLAPDRTFGQRMWTSISLSVLIWMALYWPAGWLITRVADPRVITERDRYFESDDVILVDHWYTPSPGGIVLYRLPDERIPTRALGHERVFIELTGERVDRILAGPGDQVRWRDGHLTLNGAKSPWLPLDPGFVGGPLTFSVPAGHVLILPSTTAQFLNIRDPSVWQTLSIIPISDVVGRAYIRTHPLRRFKILK